jgi:hypothetical protein
MTAADDAVLRLVHEVAELRRRLDAMESASGLFAADKDLDDPRGHGDPVIKFEPKGWRGQPHRGRKMSASDPDFLDLLADALAYSAAHPKDGKEKFVPYNLRDAARARSWARRLRAGWAPAERDAVGEFPGEPAPAFAAPRFEAPQFSASPFDDVPFDDGDLLP